MFNQFKAARNASVPILAIETFDQQATIRTIGTALNGDAPIMSWDIIRGLTPLNNPASDVVSTICQNENPAIATGNPAEMLAKVPSVPAKSIIFFMNVHRYFASNDPTAVVSISQGMMNLRDVYKSKRAMLVLLGPYIALPDELKQDVMVISESLPDYAQIEGIIQSISNDAGMKPPKDMDKIADTLVGLSAFSAEQTLATCIEKNGKKIDINRPKLWERKCKAIEQTDGLSIWRGGETFEESMRGCRNVADFTRKVLSGRERPRCIVFIDEIEKMFAGSAGDTSGTSQDQLGVILSFMQDKEAAGIILIGHPGCAKSLLAKCAGNSANIPTILFDVGGMKSKFVGESGSRTRNALKVIDAISQGKMFFIVTSNNISSLPPELRSRFTLGTFFFDLPTKEERSSIWELYTTKYDIMANQIDAVECEDWTGREIKACCNIAYRLNLKLSEAAQYIVPVSRSSADKVESLRKEASGKYISANQPGLYKYEVASNWADNKRAIA